MSQNKKEDYKIGSLVEVKSGRYINRSESKTWTIDIPTNATALITEKLSSGINMKSYIALVKGYKIILHDDSICRNF